MRSQGLAFAVGDDLRVLGSANAGSAGATWRSMPSSPPSSAAPTLPRSPRRGPELRG